MVIDYCAAGEAVGDLAAEEYLLKKYAEFSDWHIHTSSSCVILAARLLVKEGKLPAHDVRFHHEHEFVSKVDKDGKLEKHPKGFCDYGLTTISKLLRK